MDSESDSAKKIEQDDQGDLVTNFRKVRQGWAESFQLMAANRDDELLINGYISSEYDDEWEWK